VEAIFKTFFSIGASVGFGVFIFGVVPTLVFYRWLNKNR
jgi:hypothetical protein